ncbi:MAG: tetratricopeptide repeat protein [bacterium]|nr:tetratricopeptide repeat protein [bacterium]
MIQSSTESNQQTPQERAKERVAQLGPQIQEWIEQSNHTDILGHYDEMVALAFQSEDNSLIAKVFNIYGSYFWRVGEADRAFSCMQKALVAARNGESHVQIGSVLNNIGNVFRVRGFFEEAIENFEMASKEFRLTDDIRGLAYTQGNIAAAYIETEQHALAEPYILEAIRLFREAGDKQGEANFLGDYAKIQLQLKQIDQAVASAERAISLVDQTKDPHTYGTLLNSLGLMYAGANRKADAKAVLEQALQMHRLTHNLRFVGVTLTNLGYLVREMGDTELAIQYYREAAAIQHEISDVRGETISYSNIASVNFSQRNWEECLVVIKKALASMPSHKDPKLLFEMLMLQAEVYRRMGDLVEAYAVCESAEDFAREQGKDALGIPICFKALLSIEHGDLAAAEEWFAKASKVVSPETPEAYAMYWIVRTMYWYTIATHIGAVVTKPESDSTRPTTPLPALDQGEAMIALQNAYREELVASDINANRTGKILIMLHNELQAKLTELGVQ